MDSGADLAYKPGALTQAQLMSSTRDLFVQNSANVFRRFPREATEQMVKFYTQALALKSLNPIQLTASQQMLLTGAGSGQIKLSAGTQGNRKYHLEGGYKAGTGIRYFRLTYPDAAAVAKRFTDAGFAAPRFTDQGDGTKAAMVTDPGGFGIEVVIKPGAKDGSNDGVGVGISVSNLEKSRAFYREFVGLDELPAIKDKALGLTLYPYRRGETVLYLYHAGENLPQDNGSAGIQLCGVGYPHGRRKGRRRATSRSKPRSTSCAGSISSPSGSTTQTASPTITPRSRASLPQQRRRPQRLRSRTDRSIIGETGPARSRPVAYCAFLRDVRDGNRPGRRFPAR